MSCNHPKSFLLESVRITHCFCIKLCYLSSAFIHFHGGYLFPEIIFPPFLFCFLKICYRFCKKLERALLNSVSLYDISRKYLSDAEVILFVAPGLGSGLREFNYVCVFIIQEYYTGSYKLFYEGNDLI